jgi:hypothetical protein
MTGEHYAKIPAHAASASISGSALRVLIAIAKFEAFADPLIDGKNMLVELPALPSKPRIGAGGQPMIGSNGKPVYTPILEWPDKETSARWSDLVIALIKAEHPGMLGGGGGR